VAHGVTKVDSVRPTDEKSSGETARPDARHRRSRTGATGRQVVAALSVVEVKPRRPRGKLMQLGVDVVVPAYVFQCAACKDLEVSWCSFSPLHVRVAQI
jgi:hypothetical protein